MKAPAWSFSALNAFETCPRQYFHVKVARDVREEKHVATVWGTEVHGHMENHVRDGTPMPPALKPYEPLMKPIIDSPGEKLIEKQLAVNEKLEPCGWKDPDVWCRGIIDAGVLTRKSALLLDWKTGKRKPNSDQLKLFAGLAFSHFPELLTVTTGFVWLKTNVIDKETFTRGEAPMIWGEFAPRIVRFQRAFAQNHFPPKPNGLCAKWCPVPKSKCQFSGKP